jgi:hypothetical protein
MHFVEEKEGNKPQSEGKNRRVLASTPTRRQLIAGGAVAVAGLALGATSACTQGKMPETQSTGPDKTQQTNQASTTTLNVVFNGAMIMGFGDNEITVIAPEIVDDLHYYKINDVDFRGTQLKVAISGSPGRPTTWDDIIDRSRVLILNRKDTKGMPVAGPKDATITLPYPNYIYPLRSLEMRFDNAAGNGRWAGALVFVYTAAVDRSIVVTGTSTNCTVQHPIANYSDIHVLASLRPKSPDCGDQHSVQSWKAIATLIHKDWQWKSGKELNPQPRRVPGMDHDVDDPTYYFPGSAQHSTDPVAGCKLGGGNCKVQIVVVT